MGLVLLLALAAVTLVLWPWRTPSGRRTVLPGLAVLAISGVVLTLPLLLPEAEPPPVPRQALPPAPRAGQMPEPLVLPAEPDVVEIEPNDRLRSANQLALGSTVVGTTRGGPDWYVIPLDPSEDARIELFLTLTQRHVRTGGVEATVLDARREYLDTVRSGAGATRLRLRTGGSDRLYVVVEDYVFGPHDYELSTRLEGD